MPRKLESVASTGPGRVSAADDRQRRHVQQTGVAFYIETLRGVRNLFEKLGEVFIAPRNDVVAAHLQLFVIHTPQSKKNGARKRRL